MNRSFLAVLAALLTAGCINSPRAREQASATPRATMRVHCIDVGQGAATLFEFADGAVLVDTGGEQNAQFDSVESLRAYLDAFFVRRADLGGRLTSLVVTHPHLDHTRGIPMVLERYAPRCVVTNGQAKGSGSEQQNELQAWASRGEKDGDVLFQAVDLAEIPAQGLTDTAIDPVNGRGVDPAIAVLWGQVATDPGWGEAYNRARFDNQNNHCVVLRVEFGEASVLVTGDLEEAAIADLLDRYRGTDRLDVDLYVVGHHGSHNGTTDELLQALTPTLAVIEVGPPTRQEDWTAWKHGHPKAETLDELDRGVSGSGEPREVMAGVGRQTFQPRTVRKAVYATGWDGDLVFEADADGAFRRVASDRKPAH
jgi:competence protein ComEC